MTNPTPEQQLLSIMGGQLQALTVCVNALLTSMPESQRATFLKNYDKLAEHAQAVSIPTPVPDLFLDVLKEALAQRRSAAGGS